MRRIPLELVVVALSTCSPLPAQGREPVVHLHPDGTPHERYTVDAEGRRHGTYERFEPPGVLAERAAYRHGTLEGRYESYWADGGARLVASYRGGQLHGKVEERSADGKHESHGSCQEGQRHGVFRIYRDGELASKQRWRDGRLHELDGLQPFDRSCDELRAALAGIDRADPGEKAPVAERRAAALHRLMAYRYLCRVPHEGMALVDEWNELCTAAAEVVHRNGALSHTPPKPPDISEERYRQGAIGAGSSNLAAGGGMVASIDSYMDDSDPSNIDRVGHRRWCLNPVLKKTGFGESGGYSAMWSFDASGKRPKNVDAVLYPPSGYVPVDYFGARHAWSIALLKGGTPKLEELTIAVRELDEHYVAAREPLPLDHVGIAAGGQGTGACLVFRPEGVRVVPGARYLVEVRDSPRGRPSFRYVVEFCAAVKGS